MRLGPKARALVFASFGALVLLVALSFGLPSCADTAISNPLPQPPPVNSVAVDGAIGPEGGTLTHPTGARIVVPPGALTAPTQLTLTGIAARSADVLGGAPLGQGFAAGPEGQVFLKPVEVIVPFDPTRLPAGASATGAQLRVAAHGTNDFVALQSTVDVANRTIKASTTHFTDFIPAVNPNPVFITTSPTLPDATVGTPYTKQLAAAGGSPPYAWNLSAGSGLPPGLSLDANGAVSGTPTIPTVFAFFVTAADTANHRVQMAFTLTVNASANPVPLLVQISPTSAVQGSATTAITLDGSGFVPASQALWDGTPLATTFIGSTELAASIPASALVDAGPHRVSVISPGPGGGTSASVAFTVTPATPNPLPTIASVSPTALPISSVDAQIAITGTNFIPTSSAVIGAQGISTSYVSPTRLNATIRASYLGTAGTLAIGIYNPTPGGGFSPTTIPVTVGTLNPLPSLTAIDPSSTLPGSSDFTLTATGTSFVQGGVLFFGSTSLVTTVASSTTATATVPGSLIVRAGVVQVTFVNPAPGGGASGPLPFTIGSLDAGADGGADGDVDACFNIPTDAGPCGQVGASCCNGTSCNDPTLACFNGLCAEACGHRGEPCCTTGCKDGVCSGGYCTDVGGRPGWSGVPCSGPADCPGDTICSPITPTLSYCIYPQPQACVPVGTLGCGSSDCCSPSSYCAPSSTTSAVGKCCIGRGGACRASNDCCGESMGCVNGFCEASPAGWPCVTDNECGIGSTFCCDPCTHRCGVTSSPGGVCVMQATLNPVPTFFGDPIPAFAAAGATGFTLELNGTGLTPDTQLLWDGTPIETSFANLGSDQRCMADLAPSLLTVGEHAVALFNPAPGGGTSAASYVLVESPVVAPALLSVSPSQIPVSAGPVQITLAGTNLLAASNVFLGSATVAAGSGRLAVTSWSPTKIVGDLPASWVAAPGLIVVAIVSEMYCSPPGPGCLGSGYALSESVILSVGGASSGGGGTDAGATHSTCQWNLGGTCFPSETGTYCHQLINDLCPQQGARSYSLNACDGSHWASVTIDIQTSPCSVPPFPAFW